MEINKELPKEYKDVINSKAEELKKVLGENILGILLIGSCSDGTVISGWSDIDLLLIFKKLNNDIIEKTKSVINNSSIKIGITFYTQEEIKKGYIDSKSYYYLYLQKINRINFVYLNSNLILPKLTIKKLKEINIITLLNDIHVCKRNLLYEKYDTKVQFKKNYVIMKQMLIIKDKYAVNYYQTFNMFSKEYNFEYFDYEKYIKNYINKSTNEKYLKRYSIKLLNFVTNNILKL